MTFQNAKQIVFDHQNGKRPYDELTWMAYRQFLGNQDDDQEDDGLSYDQINLGNHTA